MREPVSIDFRLSLSAHHAVSKELSAPTLPDWADAIETDWPITATHGMSDMLRGPWFNRSACTAARTFGSEASWSILLITPTVLVPKKQNQQLPTHEFHMEGNRKWIRWICRKNTVLSFLFTHQNDKYMTNPHSPPSSFTILTAFNVATSGARTAGITTSNITSLCSAYFLWQQQIRWQLEILL